MTFDTNDYVTKQIQLAAAIDPSSSVLEVVINDIFSVCCDAERDESVVAQDVVEALRSLNAPDASLAKITALAQRKRADQIIAPKLNELAPLLQSRADLDSAISYLLSLTPELITPRQRADILTILRPLSTPKSPKSDVKEPARTIQVSHDGSSVQHKPLPATAADAFVQETLAETTTSSRDVPAQEQQARKAESQRPASTRTHPPTLEARISQPLTPAQGRSSPRLNSDTPIVDAVLGRRERFYPTHRDFMNQFLEELMWRIPDNE